MIEFSNTPPIKNAKIFDSHAHYDDERFDGILEELLPTLKEKGVDKIINCGCDFKTNEKSLKIAENFDFVYFAVGIHPGNIDSGTTISDIENFAKHKKCVAIGEIGLDYYWVSDNKEKQKEIFIKQILLAKELDLPVIVHDREAHQDTLEILQKYKPKGVVHSFSGSVEMAEEILKLGMYLGIGGVITFKNAKKLPDVVKIIPNELLLVETDCPYLAPEPYRGKLCHSGLIKYTAQKIADIRDNTLQNILELTCTNAKTLFNIK